MSRLFLRLAFFPTPTGKMSEVPRFFAECTRELQHPHVGFATGAIDTSTSVGLRTARWYGLFFLYIPLAGSQSTCGKEPGRRSGDVVSILHGVGTAMGGMVLCLCGGGPPVVRGHGLRRTSASVVDDCLYLERGQPATTHGLVWWSGGLVRAALRQVPSSWGSGRAGSTLRRLRPGCLSPSSSSLMGAMALVYLANWVHAVLVEIGAHADFFDIEGDPHLTQ